MRLSRHNVIAVSLLLLTLAHVFYGNRLCEWASGQPRGNELLFIAASGGNVADIHRALSQGASVDARSEGNLTPLMIACSSRHPHIVKTLLELGADPDAHAGYGITPMYNAIIADDAEVVHILISAGADIQVVRYGETLVEVANRYQSYRAASALKQRGAPNDA